MLEQMLEFIQKLIKHLWRSEYIMKIKNTTANRTLPKGGFSWLGKLILPLYFCLIGKLEGSDAALR